MQKFNVENTLKFFGESKHGATIVVSAIAVFKGIFIPMFTMMDKKSDPETKKYAAIREGLTEIVALPVYIATPILVEKFIVNKLKSFKDASLSSQSIIKGNAKFLSICAATLLIPAVCNLIQPPIMDAYKRRQESKKAKTQLDITSNVNTENLSPITIPATPLSKVNTQLATKANYGMKVGG